MAVRYVPVWSVYYDKGDGEGYNKRLDDQAFSIPKTDCVVQEPNHGEGSDGHFIRKVACRSGEIHIVDCEATIKNQQKKCHVIAEKFSLNLTIKVYPHLGNKPQDADEPIITAPAPDLRGGENFEYTPSWSVSYNNEYHKLPWQDVYPIPGTVCVIQAPNNDRISNEPLYMRDVKCGEKTHTLKCDGSGREETICSLEKEKFTLSIFIRRSKPMRDIMREGVEFEKNHPGTY